MKAAHAAESFGEARALTQISGPIPAGSPRVIAMRGSVGFIGALSKYGHSNRTIRYHMKIYEGKRVQCKPGELSVKKRIAE
jgi:hypothetical protein